MKTARQGSPRAPGGSWRSATTSPSNVVTNDDLAQTVDTNDEWIRSPGRHRERRIAGPSETVVDMAVAGGGKALAAQRPLRRRHRPGHRRHLLAGDAAPTSPPGRRTGSASPRPARSTSTPPAPASATRWPPPTTRSAPARPRNVLVIGAEKLSDWIDWTDRSTGIIFGDGAGAAVVGPSERAPGIGPVVWGCAGDKSDSDHASRDRRRRSSHQEGQAVFRWATTALPRSPCRPASAPASTPRTWPRSSRTRPTCASSRRSRASSAPDNAVVANDIVESGQHLRRLDPAGPVQVSSAARCPRARRPCCSASAAA